VISGDSFHQYEIDWQVYGRINHRARRGSSKEGARDWLWSRYSKPSDYQSLTTQRLPQISPVI